MRLFVGVPVPADPAYSELAKRLAAMGGKPVADGSWHVTLRFLGEIADSVPVAAAMEQAVQGVHAVSATFPGLGGFPSRGRARIAWMGVQADRMFALAESVRNATAGFGEPERKPFHAHVTLARFREGVDLRDLPVVAAPPPAVLDQVVLFRSALGPSGSTYDAVRTWRLPHA